MSSTMSIVLPSRKKKSDIFAPSKAIQDAKEKIGPAYFDISLLECSRNAVELTKLIAKWEDLEKEKMKIMKDIGREEEILVRSLKAHRRSSNTGKSRVHITSFEGIETIDGKFIPPGFRFKANGDIKPSTLALPLVDIKNRENDDICVESSEIQNAETVSKKYHDVDGNYQQEISDLEAVIRDIHTDLLKFKIGSEKFPSSEKFHTYLRSHRNAFIPTDDIYSAHFINSPNDRFAFKPGSTAKLHKPGTKTPTYRCCTGCKFKMRCNINEDMKLHKAHSEALAGKIRWSYVPHGKYVHSTSSVIPKTPKTTESSCRTEQTRSILKERSKSRVKFQASKEEIISRSILGDDNSKSSLKSHSMPVSNSKSPSLRACSKKSLASESDRGRTLSSVSGMSEFSSTRITPSLLIDHESRLSRLKRLQEEEQQFCDIKVRSFLNKLNSSTKAALFDSG